MNGFEKFEELVKEGKYILLFYADWCQYCEMLKPLLIQILEEKYSEKDLKLVFINIDEFNEIAEKYNVKSLPTTIFLKSGSEVGRIVGYYTRDELEKKIDGYVK